jgi:transposase InsO family protein
MYRYPTTTKRPLAELPRRPHRARCDKTTNNFIAEVIWPRFLTPGRAVSAVAALKAAIRVRQPPKGCIHHSDRGSQYASKPYRHLLAEHGLVGSMGRRGNPYDNAKVESFMKTLKVEAVYLMDYKHSKTSPPMFHALSMRSTTPAGSTPRSAT